MKRAENHLTLATAARSYMRAQVEKCKEDLKRVFEENGVLNIPPMGSSLPACSNDITAHLSFDFAQQVTKRK